MTIDSSLAPHSFLQALPQCLAPAEAIVLDGIGVSVEAVKYCYKRMQAAAHAIDVSSANVPPGVRVSMFVDAWAIVDHTHNIRSLLSRFSEQFPDPRFDDFCSTLEAVYRLRNAMDHLTSNVDNLSTMKSTRPPIHGMLSFMRTALTPEARQRGSGELRPQDIQDCHMVMLTMGACIHPTHRGTVAMPAGRPFDCPVGNFCLDGFGYRIDLSGTYSDVRSLQAVFDTDVRTAFEKQARENALALGVPMAATLEPRAAGITAIATVKLSDAHYTQRATAASRRA